MDEVEFVVIGAGVIGLAVARALAALGHETVVLEAEERFGSAISSRNSEVIHAGIHYPAGSLKARLCIEGRDLLYEFCRQQGVGQRRCGKLIVATGDAELAQLTSILATAQANGVVLEVLDGTQARALEPAVHCVGALYAPMSGIVDSHGYMLALIGDAERHSALFVYNTRVTAMQIVTDGVLIAVNGEAPTVRARKVVNCAGLYAPQVARLISGFPAEHIPRGHFVKGSYFALSGPSPFQRLIYPVPAQGGLGIHLTIDLAGRARFGPDVQWLDPDREQVHESDYAVDEGRSAQFYPAIRRYWPALPEGGLQAAYSGIRPRISMPGEPLVDFRIDGARRHGVRPIVNLFGIESPGLTASLAVAAEVVRVLNEAG
ncbi:MAG TPA: NAD(P)/FAD-dependent oxidoreductase [Steroidobacteraceae bacterium]|jgi:L-2-hydroxyglutarate oxidase LhgO